MAMKSIQRSLRILYDNVSGDIKMAGQGLAATTVSNDPKSVRHHPNL